MRTRMEIFNILQNHREIGSKTPLFAPALRLPPARTILQPTKKSPPKRYASADFEIPDTFLT